MRKFLIAAVVSATALTAAAPAAAQYYPAPQQPYGNAYGHQQQQNARGYIYRLDQIRYQIERLDRRDVLSERESRSLRNEAYYLRNRIQQSGYNGLNWRERRDIDNRIVRLEQRVRYEATDGNRRNGGRQDGWRDDRRDGWIDRDRDGRDDRYEDDRGRYPG